MTPKALENLLLDTEALAKFQRSAIGGADVTGDYDIDYEPVRALFEAHPELVPFELDETVGNYLIVQNWRRSKTVYTFDRDLIDALQKTSAPELHTKLLQRLPHNTFFINFGTDNAPLEIGESIGAFVSINVHSDGAAHIGVVDVLSHDAQKHAYLNNTNVFLIQNGENVFAAVYDAFHKAGELVSGTRLENIVCKYILILQCAYYLAAQNADIQPVKSSKMSRPRHGDGKRLNIRKWDVGFRVGAAYRVHRTAESAAPTDSGTPRNRPRPHVRRAHWHHFWCGSGESKRLEVRWLSPMFVNAASEEDDIIATERAVDSEVNTEYVSICSIEDRQDACNQ